MLKNPFGVYLYFLLRNDYSWSLLSDKEKAYIQKLNIQHNSFRDDYLTPEKNEKNWQSFKDIEEKENKDITRLFLHTALLDLNPEKVLEIGPGAGFLSHMVCKHRTVSLYDSIDINEFFSNYINNSINNSFVDGSLKHNHYVGNASTFNNNKKYDMIIILNAVHHIPDRFIFFDNLIRHLSDDGVIVAVDPSHYLKRILLLTHKIISNGMLKKSYYMHGNNLSTHHMCSEGEYSKIVKQHNMRISSIEFNHNKLINIGPFKKYFSSQIGVVLRKK